jgi:hypothetical protein
MLNCGLNIHRTKFFVQKAKVVKELGSKVAEEERFKLLDGKKMAEGPRDTPK